MSRKTTVLVVDDISLMRAMLTRYIKTLGHKIIREELGPGQIEILEAGDGKAALEILSSQPTDLIFLDLMMPVMDGLTFLEKKREDAALAAIPVIVCSALGERETIDRATELGAAAYIVKPFTLQSVEKKFREAFAKLNA